MPGLASTAVPLREAFDGALVDLDGVLYRGGSAIDHAVAELRDASTAGMVLSYVTNNSARPPATVAEQIRGYGLECDEEDVLTSAQSAARLLAEHLPERGRVLPIGGDGLRLALEHEGFTLCGAAEDRPRAVVQGFSAQLTWRDLAEAAYAINAGAIHLATNLDAAIPDERGIAPGNGALVGAVVAATDRLPLASGKPTPEIFHLAAERSGARRPLVIGDRLDTDLQGARAAGMPGLLVLTGVSAPHDALLAPPSQRPSFLGADLRALSQPHPAPRREVEGWWVCSDAAARVVDGELRIAAARGGDSARRLTAPESRITLDEWRALCAAAWDFTDTVGEKPQVPTLDLATP